MDEELMKAFDMLREARKKVNESIEREMQDVGGTRPQDSCWHLEALSNAFSEEMKAFMDYYAKSRKRWGDTQEEIDERLLSYFGLVKGGQK